MDHDPDLARLAAIDQELAALDERLTRHARSVMRGDAVVAVGAVVLILFQVIAKPHVYRWELVAALVAIALGAAGSFVQGLTLRTHRTEIRELRARVG